MDTPDPLVSEITDRIRKRKKHWEKPFNKMREYQAFVRKGASKEWDDIIVNVALRHVRDWTSQLYARQPKTVFRRRPRMEFTIWDETPEKFQQAKEVMARADPAMAAAMGLPPALDTEVIAAEALIRDVVEGMGRRETMDKIGKTAVHLYEYFRDEQSYGSRQPMKRMIRRGYVNGVSYVRPGFQRETGRDPEWQRKMHDHKTRLDEIQRMMREQAEDQPQPDSAEAQELQQAIAALEMEDPILLRKGLTINYPASTAIIPDEHMTDIMDFEGCEEVCEEFIMTKEAAEAAYGIEIDTYLPYTGSGKSKGEHSQEGMVCIWQNWNIRTGLVHTVCDGFNQFLTQDFRPPVYSEHFWPWLAFAPNPSDDPENPWPVSVIETIKDTCMEINRAAAGRADARYANRPGTFGPGVLSEKDARKINSRAANEHIALEVPVEDLENAIRPFPTPPFNEGLYTQQPMVAEIELATGVSEARFEASSRVSATAVSISEAGHSSNVDSIRDELDDLNTRLARMSGQILMLNMTEEEVREIVGPGAMWPEMDMDQITKELHLEVEFGSSGLPNQARLVATLRDLGPLLVQIPGLSSTRFGKKLLEAVDQNMDLADFFDPNQPMSIQGQNAAAGGQGNSLGGGSDNGPRPPAAASNAPAIVS